MEKRVLYKKKDEKGALKKLLIENDKEPAHKIAQKIRFKECIENKLHIALYYNKSGEPIKDQDMIAENTFIDYDTMPLSQVPLSLPTPLTPAQNIQSKKPVGNTMGPPQQHYTPSSQMIQGSQGRINEQQTLDEASFASLVDANKKQSTEYFKHISLINQETNAANRAGGSHGHKPRGGGHGQGGLRQGMPAHPLPTGYVCFRCNQQGHHIKDCPTNQDETFDTYHGKGVPKEHLWKRDLGISAQEFLENKSQNFRKIVKEVQIFHAGELLPRLQQNNDVLQILYDSMNQTSDSKKISTQKLNMPPSLQCYLCKGLINKACLTKCCGSFSACQKCLQEYLIKSKLHCPLCKSGNIYVEDLIPNQQLRLIAEWYSRQLMINDKIEETQVVRPFNSDYTDIMSMLSKYDRAKVVPQSNSNEGSNTAKDVGEEFEVASQNMMSIAPEVDQLMQNEIPNAEVQEEAKESSEMLVKTENQIDDKKPEEPASQKLHDILSSQNGVVLSQSNANNPLKFNPQLHSGTKYDPTLGRRVPVTDPNDLPKISAPGLNPLTDLQAQAAHQQQIAMMQMMQHNYRMMQSGAAGAMPNQAYLAAYANPMYAQMQAQYAAMMPGFPMAMPQQQQTSSHNSSNHYSSRDSGREKSKRSRSRSPRDSYKHRDDRDKKRRR